MMEQVKVTKLMSEDVMVMVGTTLEDLQFILNIMNRELRKINIEKTETVVL